MDGESPILAGERLTALVDWFDPLGSTSLFNDLVSIWNHGKGFPKRFQNEGKLMSSRSLPKLVSNSPDFISIDKTVVANIDETYRRVIDACAVLEGVEALHWTDHDDDGQLTASP